MIGGTEFFRNLISCLLPLPCEKMRKIAEIHALRPHTLMLILLSLNDPELYIGIDS
jgi:hypothetical protein